MELERQKAILLANNIKEFVNLVNKSHVYDQFMDPNKSYRLTLIVEEFRITTISDELLRINQHTYEERSSRILIDRFRTAFKQIAEYVGQNEDDLFLFTGRIDTLVHDLDLFPKNEDEL
ncbi:hypothetical protein M3182_00105 [Mesobacillus maritimus]|uniref:hypothetical protein n=1 Tax=Mesobacillus maritimus TaxID=1643336 RepID=UPI00203FB5C1|nr:hypothetical protein [Mesobacillus maritimus]MCM3584152.1 hypothetical protein [Mesobacillus maritimus]MCM3669386.1 hypothetical protein [Mesobacillus maritimus]